MIKGKCPKCNTKIQMNHFDVSQDSDDFQDFVFEVIRDSSSRSYSIDRFTRSLESKPLFEEVIGYFNDTKQKRVKEVIENEINKLKQRIDCTNDPRDLLNISKQIAKFDVKIRDDLRETIKKEKSQLMNVIRKKVGNRKSKVKNERKNQKKVRHMRNKSRKSG